MYLFSSKYALLYVQNVSFLPGKKNRRSPNRSLAPGAWRYPITLRSLVVRSTARTQKIKKTIHFSHIFLTPDLFKKWPHEWSGAVIQCYLRRILTRIFSMFSKTFDFHDFWAHGPWANGTHMPIGIFKTMTDKPNEQFWWFSTFVTKFKILDKLFTSRVRYFFVWSLRSFWLW